MPQKLVIVESPAKARTLSKMLGRGYEVKASMGHVRDLPKKEFGVDIENDFMPRYVMVAEKRKVVAELKQSANGASAIYLATDPDREGEAISWHLIEAAMLKKDGVPLRRVAFHEITREAVEAAFQHPRSIDMNLVNAQQARRILDRLVGYKLSPLLWRKVRKGLSAGRVQSSALRLIVDREKEIASFKPQEFWVLQVRLAKPRLHEQGFVADLVGTGSGEKIAVDRQASASRIVEELERSSYGVAEVRKKELARQPAPPFITSTMQQEAWRKLRFSAERTMRIAQQLYEGLPVGEEGSVGLITYMRTDSTQVAASALNETREYIAGKYGSSYLTPSPRRYVKKAKWAQEAHEAIRPTSVLREPAALQQYLDADQSRLYELIWKRMVASQMANAAVDSTTVDVKSDDRKSGRGYLLRATSSVVTFPGFMTLYIEGKDEEEEGPNGKGSLPELGKGEALDLLAVLPPEQKFTQPPPRYTEATLIKALEQKGIGRPSTYASIVSVVVQRDYVQKVQSRFKPTELGTVVNDLLVKNFPDVADLSFTAHMEEELDEIARGEKAWMPVLSEFYKPFQSDLDRAHESIERVKFKDEPVGEACPTCGKPMVQKVGRFGRFVACSGYPACRFTRPFYVKTGVKCPDCGGEIVQRQSKKKRTFYGCINYPRCQFATGRRPLAAPCPKCKGLLTQFGKRTARCVKCNYRGPMTESPDEARGDEAASPLVGATAQT